MSNEKYRQPYTDYDFSKHELIIKETEDILIHHLKLPDTITHNVKFINTQDLLVVTGDYGNWMFCREFHPSADGYVSSGYWCEKAGINSVQKVGEFDGEGTREEIKEYIEERKAEDVEISAEVYVSFAYDNMPSDWCSEDVPHGKKIKTRLLVVFDAFNEICRRLDNE